MKKRAASASGGKQVSPPSKAPRRATPKAETTPAKPSTATRKQIEASKKVREQAEAAAAASRKKAEEAKKHAQKLAARRAEAEAAAKKKQEEEEMARRAEEAAAAAKRRREEEEMARRAAEAAAAAKRKADMEAARRRAPEAVQQARLQVEAAEAAAMKMAEEGDAARRAAGAAAEAHGHAQGASEVARRTAEEARAAAERLLAEAEEARKAAERAAEAAAAARGRAEAEAEAVCRLASEEEAAKRAAEQEAERAAAHRASEVAAARGRAEEDARAAAELKVLCTHLDLEIADERNSSILEVLEDFVAKELAAAHRQAAAAQAEREAKEAAEKAREKEAKEAAEKAEREAQEAAERAREKEEKEAAEKAEREAKEAAEKAREREAQEAAEKAEREAKEAAEKAREREAKEAAEKAEREAMEAAEKAREKEIKEAAEKAEREAREAAEKAHEREAKEAAEKAEREAKELAEEARRRAVFAQIGATIVVPEGVRQTDAVAAANLAEPTPRLAEPAATAEPVATAAPATTDAGFTEPAAGAALAAEQPEAVSSSSSAAPNVETTGPAADVGELRAAPESPTTFHIPDVEGDSFADTAAALHQTLFRELVAKREALDQQLPKLREAEAAQAAAYTRHEAAEEAARPDTKKKEEALSTARRNVVLMSEERSELKAVRDGFGEIRESVSVSKSSSSTYLSLKPRLKRAGVGQELIDALGPILARKRRMKGDMKVLSSVDQALAARDATAALLFSNCNKEVTKCAEAVAVRHADSQARRKELDVFNSALKARQEERRQCEEEAAAAVRLLQEHEERMTRERVMRFSLQSEQCSICCEEFAAGKLVWLGCNHGWYCKECVRRFVEARLDAGTAGDIPCPSCGDRITEKDLITLLPRKIIFRLHARTSEQKAVASGMRACPTPDCPWRFTVSGQPGSERQTCPLCEKESCLLCGVQPYHDGRTCEQHRKRTLSDREAEEGLRKWIEATGSKQCPTCHVVTTKENLEKQSQQRVECHKMLCRNCNTRWCFKCEAVLTDSYTCGCTIDAHGFIDPKTGKRVQHLKRGKKKAD